MPLAGSTFAKPKPKPKKRPPKNKWYLDVKYWNKDPNVVEKMLENKSKLATTDDKLQKRLDAVKKIPELHIAKAYKLYLKQAMKHDPAARIPHFLEAVDDSILTDSEHQKKMDHHHRQKKNSQKRKNDRKSKAYFNGR